jgi:hypothetical protein
VPGYRKRGSDIRLVTSSDESDPAEAGAAFRTGYIVLLEAGTGRKADLGTIEPEGVT